MKKLLNIESKFLEELGVLDWGYFENTAPLSLDRYNEWVLKGLHKPLGYLADERQEKRQDLKNFYPDCESAIVFLFPYINEKKAQEKLESKFKLSSYIYAFDGVDYHFAIKERLEKIALKLKESNELEYTFSIDAQPVLERDMAYKAGLGWFGKNSMIINKEHGSYFLLSSILINKKLNIEKNEQDLDHCGTCTSCIDLCPTDAIDPTSRTVVTEKCISNFTIELFKDETVPPKGYSDQPYIYGCDICQEVCPWNSKPIENASDITLNSSLHQLVKTTANLENLDQLKAESKRGFKKIFGSSPIGRTGKEGFLKNILRRS